jgi:DHA3 family macrolide efflux protein-like MFS transporter
MTLGALLWVIRERNARLLWVGRSSTYLADQLHEIALVWMAWELTRSSTLAALAAFATRAPLWALGSFAGVYADRLPRQLTVIAANGVSAALAFAIVFLFAVGILPYPVLVLMAFLLGVTRSLEAPALIAHIPSLVSTEAITRINTVADNTKRVARLSASLLVAALRHVLPVPGFYAIVGVAYLAMSGCAAMFRVRHVSSRGTAGRFLSELVDGWRALRESRVVLLTVACFALYNPAYAAAYWVGLPRLAGDTLAGGVGAYSLVVGAIAAGGLAGNLCITVVAPRNHALATISGILIVGLGFALMAASPGMAMVIVIAFALGFGFPLMDIGVPSLIHENIAPQHLGRVYSLWRQFAEAGIAMGLLVAGPLVDWLGPRGALVLFGSYVAPVALVSFVFVSKTSCRSTGTYQRTETALPARVPGERGP